MSRAASSLAIPVSLLRPAIIAAALVLLLLQGGCSVLRLAYGQADAVAFRWLDGYVDFNDAQELRAREGIDRWFAWNRRTQLAGYAALLARIDVALGSDTTAQAVCDAWSEIHERIDVGLDQAVPALAEIGLLLQPAQVANVQRRFADSNRRFRDDFLQPDPERRHGAAVRRVVERAESLYGRLDEAQRARVAERVAASPFDPQLAFEERLARQHVVLALMRRLAAGEIDPGRAQDEIRVGLMQVTQSTVPLRKRHAEQLVEHNCRMAAGIHNETSGIQRQIASDRVRDWVTDLRALATPG